MTHSRDGWGQGLSEKWGEMRDGQRSLPQQCPPELGGEGAIHRTGQGTVLGS